MLYPIMIAGLGSEPICRRGRGFLYAVTSHALLGQLVDLTRHRHTVSNISIFQVDSSAYLYEFERQFE